MVHLRKVTDVLELCLLDIQFAAAKVGATTWTFLLTFLSCPHLLPTSALICFVLCLFKFLYTLTVAGG